MRIVDVKTHMVKGIFPKAPWILVEVKTDEGITGWGDATNFWGGYIVEKTVHELREVVIGQDPSEIERLWAEMYRALYYTGISGAVIGGITGIEIACWDIIGKSLGAPVYKLLGGRCRSKLRLYANNWFAGAEFTPEAYAERAVAVVEKGFKGVKFDPFNAKSLNRSLTRDEERHGIEMVRAVREAVGPDIDIALDIHGALDVRTARRVAAAFEEFDLLFLEEPVPPENVDAMAKVAADTRIPICTGERLFTRHGFRELLEKQVADIIMPDVVRTGGILETKKIAAMAEIYYVSVAPHNPNSPVATLASAHTVATLPNFLQLEFFYPDVPYRDELFTEPPFHIENGYLVLSDKPGLGFEINREALKRYRYDESTSTLGLRLSTG